MLTLDGQMPTRELSSPEGSGNWTAYNDTSLAVLAVLAVINILIDGKWNTQRPVKNTEISIRFNKRDGM